MTTSQLEAKLRKLYPSRVPVSAEQAHHLKMVRLLGRNKINAPHGSTREQLRRIRQQERQALK